MKRTTIFALALALMSTMAVGCGCQNVSSQVEGMITEATGMMPTIVSDPTRETTRPTTATTPGTDASRPTDGSAATDSTRPSIDYSKAPENVNGGTNYWMDDPTEGTAPTDMARNRSRMNGRN